MVDTVARTQPEAVADPAARLARAETIVKDHVLMNATVGLIPLPGFDILAGMGIQLAMIKRLTTLYGVPFQENAARGIIMSLLGGLGTGTLAGGLFLSAAKFMPGVGTVLGVAAMPVAVGVTTCAVGKVFIAHLETGGTLATFNAAANRGYFKDLVRRSREATAGILTPSASKSPAKS